MRIGTWMSRAVLVTVILFISPLVLGAQQKGPPPLPPAKVAVAEVTSGMAAPHSTFVGTVYYQEVSEVASEVNGLVEKVSFEEGKRIKRGEDLVKLNSDLLQKTIKATRASYQQAKNDLEKAKVDFNRIERLYREGLASEQEHDDLRFKARGEEMKADSLKAEVERLEAELQRKVIKAPFDGVVLEKQVNTGEWLSPGSPVATIARSDVVDIVVNVPEEALHFIKPGQAALAESGGKKIEGKVFTVVPKGDIATRTFPVKIRVQNNPFLFEGMEAKVNLPIGKNRKSLFVHRDAVITMAGNTIVFAVIDSKATLMPVKVSGYDGTMAWVDSNGLHEGMKVVIKGNERLRDGQPVDILTQ